MEQIGKLQWRCTTKSLVHKTLNGLNPSSGFRDQHSEKTEPNLHQIWQVFGPWASLHEANRLMTMTVHSYRSRQFQRTSYGENPSSGYRDVGYASLAAACPAAHLPRPWRLYPSSLEGWGKKMLNLNLDYHIEGKWFIHGPKPCKENQLLSLEHPADYP